MSKQHLSKTHAVHSKSDYAEWNRRHTYCQLCGSSVGRFRGLTTHHLVNGSRSDEPCNLLRLCWEPCHMLAEGESIRDELTGLYYPKITFEMCLSVKLIREPDEYDPVRLAELLCRPLPEPEPIPEVFRRLWSLREDF